MQKNRSSGWYEELEDTDRFLKESVHWDEFESGMITEEELKYLERIRAEA